MLSEAFSLVDPVKKRISDHFIEKGRLPGNNRELRLPEPQNLRGTTVSSVAVLQGGLIKVELGAATEAQSMFFAPSVNPASGHLFWSCSSDTISKGVVEKLRPLCEYLPDSKERHLHRAAIQGELEELSFWLDKGADPNVFVHGLTPLMVAASAGDLEMSERLLLAGANPDVNARNHDGYTPIVFAIHSGASDLVRLLLDKNASPSKPDHHGQTPTLHASLVDSKLQTTKYSHLIHSALNPQFLSHPAESYQKPQVPIRELHEDLRLADTTRSSSPLEKAIVTNNRGRALQLIEQGVDVNQQTSNNSRPLIEASKRGYSEIVALMLASGASLEAEDNLGRTAYLAAVGAGHIDVAEILTAAGADTRVADRNGVDAVQMQRSRSRQAAENFRVALTED